MITFENEIEIARPPEEVFRYLADLENVPVWNHAIERTIKVTPGPVGAGTQYRQLRTLPRPSEETIRITALDRPGLLVVSGTLGPFGARLSYVLTSPGVGTRLVNRVELTPRGAARLVAPLAAGRIRDAVAGNLSVLKEILEQE